MNQIHKIAVIGGTGKSGTYLVNYLLSVGLPVKMLVRNPDRLTVSSGLVETVYGTVTDYDSILSLLSGCDTVISTLGMGVPPSEPTIFSQSTTSVLRAMNALGIRRYIITTGLNVDAPGDSKSERVKQATAWMHQTFPASTADKQREFELLHQSKLDWTMVRLPMIELTDELEPVVVSLTDCPGDKVSATTLAHFLAEQVSDDRYFRKAPFIANG